MKMKSLWKITKALALGLSGLLWLVVAWSYWKRPDLCAALTIWPAWFWLGPGLFLGLLGWSRRRKWLGAVVLAAWLVFLLVFVEEPRSLVRLGRWPSQEWESARLRGRALRVVSLNCAGEEKAAVEVAQYHPDIVLLQEPPKRGEVERLAERLFGRDAGVLRTVDGSIIVHGSLLPVHQVEAKHFAEARALLASGIEVEVVSTHLFSPAYNFELWSKECWNAQTDRRQEHRRQMREIAIKVGYLPKEVPLIIGGDFNAPAGDAIFRVFRPRLHDAFREGGRGWGNTVFNELPLTRIDQVWVSSQFRAVAVVAKRTENSDHRMVICDLIFQGPAKQ